MNPLMNGMNMLQMLGQLRNNPMEMLKQAGFNVPTNLNNPQEIIQHLMNSGQVSQSQLSHAQQTAQQMTQMFGNVK